MNKATMLRLINPALVFLLLLQPLSGFLLSVSGVEFFERVHIVGGIVLLTVAAIHLWLNWDWVKANLPQPADSK